MSKVPMLLFSLMLSQRTVCIQIKNFNLPNFPRINTSTKAVVPEMERFKKIEVGPINVDIRLIMKLVEFLYLNISFNYLDKVPKSEELTFRMPDI